MNTLTINSIQLLQKKAHSLLIYQSVLTQEIGQMFMKMLSSLADINPNPITCLQSYTNWFYALATKNISWENYLITAILQSDNPFSQQVQINDLTLLQPALIAAVKHDLQVLQSIYNCSCNQLIDWLQEITQIPISSVPWNQDQPQIVNFADFDDWGEAIPYLTTYYQQNGTGIFAQFAAFRWSNSQLVGINHHDQIKLHNLTAYDLQRQALIKNTLFLLAGYPALNVLLYGSRGSGKSSLIKAILNEYSHQRLRLIEVPKSSLHYLPLIIEEIRDKPYKFIIFVDDLSFEEDDDNFKSLKMILEGHIVAKPDNMVVYATSNRRHLVREFLGERPRPKDADDVHSWDNVHEKLSFSDRFGLTLTFGPADQDTYLQIVHHLANLYNLNINQEDLDFQALQWATKHNGRSGRTAKQFIDFFRAQLALNKL
ncbi:MAG TPA: ATP-binding protein [Allocoleopsis sp.]